MPELQPAPKHQPAPKQPERPPVAAHGRASLQVNDSQASSSRGRQGRSKSAQREPEPRPAPRREAGSGGSNGKLKKESDKRQGGGGASAMPPQTGALNTPTAGSSSFRGRVASESSAPGPVSPRTAFQGFFSPGHVANPGGGQSRSRPPGPPPPAGSYQSMPLSPGQRVPGSFPSSYFPQPTPPTPPTPPPPQQHTGLSSFVGGLLPQGHQLYERLTKK